MMKQSDFDKQNWHNLRFAKVFGEWYEITGINFVRNRLIIANVFIEPRLIEAVK